MHILKQCQQGVEISPDFWYPYAYFSWTYAVCNGIMQSICVWVSASDCVCVCLYASLTLTAEKTKKKEANKYGQGSGEGLVNFPKAHYLLWEQEKIIKKKKQKTHNAIVFATKAHTYTDAHQQAWPWPENCAMWNNRGVGGLLSPPLSISLWMGQQKNTKPEHVVIWV